MSRIKQGDLVHIVADGAYFGVGLVIEKERYDQTFLVLRQGYTERFWDFDLEIVDDTRA
jgi:hypothetical protein